MTEPLVTYNLFIAPVITAIASALIVAFIKHKFEERDEKDCKIAELLKEAEDRRESHVNSELDKIHAKLCDLSTTIQGLRMETQDRVTRQDCHRKESAMNKRLTDHVDRYHTRIGGRNESPG